MRRRLTLALALLLTATAALAQTPAPPPGTIEYYHVDALGSVRAVTDATGNVVRTQNYHPFGEGVGVAPGGDPMGFTGKPRDAETGLDYFGARYYGQRLGRFTTVDPKVAWGSARTNPQLWNRYAYALNNPVRFVDPDGQCVWDLCISEGTAAYMLGAAVIGTAAYLASPQGQQAATQVGGDIGRVVTATVDGIRSWFRTEKKPGTLGKPDHQATAAEERARTGGEREVTVDTPEGHKGSRRGDVVVTDESGKIVEIIQIYRPTRLPATSQNENKTPRQTLSKLLV